MKDNKVFFETAEIKRLNTQKRLFSEYEHSLYGELLKNEGLLVLDIGCNNGDKTKEKFDVCNVKSVIGLEYHKVLSDRAQREYGSEKFSFYQCNVEDEGFVELLRSIMQKHGIGGFDIINLSLVLSHLTDAPRLLSLLKQFLVPGGKLVILESDDSCVRLVPDELDILPSFMSCLEKDAFSGDRTIASRLPELLIEAGYEQTEITEVNISASGEEKGKKKDIYNVFFSYLLSDFKTLLKEEPLSEEYKECYAWLKRNRLKIKNSICKYCETISIGIKFFVAGEGEKN